MADAVEGVPNDEPEDSVRGESSEWGEGRGVVPGVRCEPNVRAQMDQPLQGAGLRRLGITRFRALGYDGLKEGSCRAMRPSGSPLVPARNGLVRGAAEEVALEIIATEVD